MAFSEISELVASFLPSVLTGAWQSNNDSGSLEHVCKRNDNMLIPPCRLVELLVPVASVSLLQLWAVESSRAEGMAVREVFWAQGWEAEAPSVGPPAVGGAVVPQVVWASLHSPLRLASLHSPWRASLHSPWELVVRASVHRELRVWLAAGPIHVPCWELLLLQLGWVLLQLGWELLLLVVALQLDVEH